MSGLHEAWQLPDEDHLHIMQMRPTGQQTSDLEHGMWIGAT
jgi:hypothetical protein